MGDRLRKLIKMGMMSSGGGIPELNLVCPTITPTLGAEMWDADAAAWTSGIYHWVKFGNNTVENDANTGKITYVDNANGAEVLLNDAADLSANLVVGTSYRIAYDLMVGSGSVKMLLSDGSGYPTTPDIPAGGVFVPGAIQFRAYHATSCFFRVASMFTGEYAWIDNQSLKPITNMTTSLGALSHQSGTYKCTPTVGSMSAAGLRVAYKDASNFLELVVDTGYKQAQLWKVVSGAWTKVTYGTITYGAGKDLILIINGTTVKLYYDGVQLDADRTVAEMASLGKEVYGYNNMAGNTVGTVTTSASVVP